MRCIFAAVEMHLMLSFASGETQKCSFKVFAYTRQTIFIILFLINL